MVLALAGRRIDEPGAEEVRFPPANTDMVKEKLKAYFLAIKPAALVCAGANGADLLALQVAAELGIQQTMVLPFDAETFKRGSVTDRPGNWGDMFNSFVNELQPQEQLVILNYPQNNNVYERTNTGILKQAADLAARSGTPSQVTAVLVWEGKAKDEQDMTAHFKQTAINMGFPIKEINTLNH